MSEVSKPRPQYRNLNLFHDIRTYRLPLAGWVSILHRASGALMFVLLPFLIWLFDKSISSEISFGELGAAFTAGLWIFPGWFIKLVVLALIWAYLHHLLAGVRHLYLDVSHRTTKEFGRHSAAWVLLVSIALTLILGAKLFGLY
ncbi:succinate dehydrogenase, cytochrome b556 subunit [Ottowia pentelensis]|uniref:Succinate dehydrogenase cytochrome b556 subunit n=1 Tax=Ottowia pentelensis TaxID=511108 RepID=A0ABV6PNE1_9BURK|nr:succinate dehydrogenase, cytochrome b556 subunit [Ottowia sp.]MBS0401441.1 succinate dehydrogenase, cytochrome b556 subunit [Pseudomonadota bacterium]MBS0415349.1 succinate dehydrogenase, cytochrome b556 subunit [Pseudomonadota bacterium]HMN56769.1 succinate dehydrogenase, cytochrome b556 subunit [Ottowia sp.]